MAKLSEEAKGLIKDTHPGFIATASAAGRPNVSIKGSFRVLDDEHVAFADVHSPGTIANLVENPWVAAIVFASRSVAPVRRRYALIACVVLPARANATISSGI